jgi:hypothetical protein
MCLYRFADAVLEQAFYRDVFGLGVVVDGSRREPESPVLVDSDESGLSVGGVRVVVDKYRGRVTADFTLTDQAGEPWTLSNHLDAAALLVFLRGDW